MSPMPSQKVPDELLALREQIDSIDEDMLDLLARRFKVTARVGELKAEVGLDSMDSVREQEKLDRLRSLAQDKSLNSEFILDLFQTLFDEVVKNHRNLLE
jgi:chorismate mutase